MRVLVTGGAGFMGANLVRRLLADGHQVTALVHPAELLWRLTPVATEMSVVHLDLNDFCAVTDLVRRLKPETIFHLASFGGLPQQQDSEQIFRTNFDATRHLLNACVEVGFDCFVNTGSSSEYGKKEKPMTETDVLEPVSDYGVAKAAATLYATRLAREHDLPIYTVRPFSVYGDFEQSTRLIPFVLAHAMHATAPELSAAHYVRDFVYVHDVVDLYLKIAHKKPLPGNVFNAGTGVQTSIGELMGLVRHLWPQCPTPSWGVREPRPWEPAYWCANVTHAAETVWWKPTTSLEDGLKQTYAWIEQNKPWYTPTGTPHETATAPLHQPTW